MLKFNFVYALKIKPPFLLQKEIKESKREFFSDYEDCNHFNTIKSY